MRITPKTTRITARLASLFVATALLLPGIAIADDSDDELAARPAPPAVLNEIQLAPYAPDRNHLWNQLHRALFLRNSSEGGQHVHSTDPLLFRGGTWLLEGEPHEQAVELLDQFLAESADRLIDDPHKRLMLQRDLWAAFDYVAWYPDDWVFKSKHEPAAKSLRARLAKAIGRLALDKEQIDALPDNYALALKEQSFPASHDPDSPDRAFLPADLFDPKGPWVRFHEQTAEPMTPRHFDGAGGRAAHVVFLRLPDGREATESYLAKLQRDTITEYKSPDEEEAADEQTANFGVIPKRWRPITQFPQGTMVAMVRRALAIDRSNKVRPTPVTELVQIRVYRRIPDDSRANRKGDFGEQDVYEFKLDRDELYEEKHGLRAVDAAAAFESFERREQDPFAAKTRTTVATLHMKSCIECHQQPGVFSMLSMQRGFQNPLGIAFREYTWDVEISYTTKAKVRGYDWGLLQGLLEAR